MKDHITNTETITLRGATLADAPALALTAGATFIEAFTWMLPGPDILAFVMQHHTRGGYEGYLEKQDTRITLAISSPAKGFPHLPGTPVGYAMLAAPDLPTFDVQPTDIELKRFYLFSRFRNVPVVDANGLVVPNQRPVDALLAAAVADARAMGRTRMLLGTHAQNLRAIAFYRRTGFIEVGTRTFHVGEQVCHDLLFAMQIGS